MKLALASDIHGKWNWPALKWPDADVLCLAGDILNNYAQGRGCVLETLNQNCELDEMCTFLKGLYKEVVIVPGNHDWNFFRPNSSALAKEICAKHNVRLLLDSQYVLEGKVFYGSPWQPWFFNWAFNFPNPDRDGQVAADMAAIRAWDGISPDADVLITHGPPYGVLDLTYDGRRVGCKHLAKKVKEIRPALHIFGHIHFSSGIYKEENTTYVNAAVLNEGYEIEYQPRVIEV